MSHKDPQLDQLYQDNDKKQPPQSVDAAILAHANQDKRSQLSRLRPWLAAASVLFTIPVLWLMLQQPELQQASRESVQPEPTPYIIEPADRVKAETKDESGSDDLASFKESDQDTITVTGSRLKRQTTASDKTGIVAEMEQADGQLAPKKAEEKTIANRSRPEPPESAPLKPVPDSLRQAKAIQFNQALLLELADTVKETKPDQLSSLQAKQWTQFEHDIDQQQWSQAQKSLKQIQQSHPNLDVTDLEGLLKQLLIQ